MKIGEHISLQINVIVNVKKGITETAGSSMVSPSWENFILFYKEAELLDIKYILLQS